MKCFLFKNDSSRVKRGDFARRHLTGLKLFILRIANPHSNAAKSSGKPSQKIAAYYNGERGLHLE